MKEKKEGSGSAGERKWERGERREEGKVPSVQSRRDCRRPLRRREMTGHKLALTF